MADNDAPEDAPDAVLEFVEGHRRVVVDVRDRLLGGEDEQFALAGRGEAEQPAFERSAKQPVIAKNKIPALLRYAGTLHPGTWQ